MDLLIKQKDKDIYYAIKKLLVLEGFTLLSFCRDRGLNYHKTRYWLNSENLEHDELQDFVSSIGAYNIGLTWNVKGVFVRITDKGQTLYERKL